MSTPVIDRDAPSLQGTLPGRPQDLPHGLLEPPGRVLEIVAANRTLPTAQILEAVFKMLRRHIGNVRIRDDLTLVVLRS